MYTGKLFENGNSQAVRLPKRFRMPGKEVKIIPYGNGVLLQPMEGDYSLLFKAAEMFSEDFMQHGREQPPMQERDTPFS